MLTYPVMMESVFLNGGDRLNKMKTELVYHRPPEDLGLKSCLTQIVEAEGENCGSWVISFSDILLRKL